MISPGEEFRRYARECRSMARDTHDPGSKTSWNNLAARWVRCAELQEAQERSERRIDKYRRERPIYRLYRSDS
jgi:hypothetical protein